jgi:hypothetical protein
MIQQTIGLFTTFVIFIEISLDFNQSTGNIRLI